MPRVPSPLLAQRRNSRQIDAGSCRRKERLREFRSQAFLPSKLPARRLELHSIDPLWVYRVCTQREKASTNLEYQRVECRPHSLDEIPQRLQLRTSRVSTIGAEARAQFGYRHAIPSYRRLRAPYHAGVRPEP